MRARTNTHYDFFAPGTDVPPAVEPMFQRIVTTDAGAADRTVSVWWAVPDDLLDFKPHEKANPIRHSTPAPPS